MALRAVLSSILSAGKKTRTPVRVRTNVATQIIKNKSVKARVNASTTVTRGSTTARISTSGGKVRVTGSTRLGGARINFGF